jgi:PAS domain S-box-containing protein
VEIPAVWYDPRALRHVSVTRGQPLALQTTWFPLFDADGTAAHVAVLYRDMTDEQRAREEQGKAEERLREAQRVASLGSWEVSLPAGTIRWSDEEYRIYGLERGEEPADYEGYVKMVHPDDRARVRAVQWAALERGEGFEVAYRIVRADGEVRELLSRGVVVRASDGSATGLCGTTHDVTERRRVEAERARLAAVFASSSDAMLITSPQGVIESWNEGAERMYGFTAEEVRGRHVTLLYPPVRRGEHAELVERLKRDGHVQDFETVRLRKDGMQIEVSVALVLVRDPAGKVLGVAAITRDITERKKLAARLLLADRMVTMGTLASGVAHEINNPLGYILGNLGFLARGLAELGAAFEGLSGIITGVESEVRPTLEDMAETLAEARQGAERVRDIVRDLKTFSRPEEGGRERVNVRRVLESSFNVAWMEIRHRARLAKQFGDVPAVEASESRLGQVFLNLLVNAAQAIPEGGASGVDNEVRVTTRTDARGWAVVEVGDTGVGIPAESLGRIFDAFYTTKPVGIGTGLGLSICRDIARSLGGEIEVESTPGVGSTFRVLLPPARAEAAASAGSATPAVLRPGRRGRVLIVDDDPMVLASLRRSVSAEHDAVPVASAHAALAELAAGQSFDAIVCDLMMPEMTGMELYDALVRTSPEHARRMIFLTAGAFSPRARQFLERVPNPCLEKPYDQLSLSAAIRERVR